MHSFVWSDNLVKIITTALLSMVPMFEGRYALTIMLGMGMPVVFSYLLALVFSTLPMPLILWLYLPFVRWIQKLPYAWLGWLKKFCAWVEKRAQHKAGKMDAVGLLGLFAFVAVPLPGTGVWMGSAIAALFGLDRVKSAIVILLGNIVACAIMTALALGTLSAAGQSVPWF